MTDVGGWGWVANTGLLHKGHISILLVKLGDLENVIRFFFSFDGTLFLGVFSLNHFRL